MARRQTAGWIAGEACNGAASHRRGTARLRRVRGPMRHAAHRAGKRRNDASKTAKVGAGGDAGGDAGEPLAAARWQYLPYWLIVAGACVALAIMRLGTRNLKSGTLVLAGVLLIAAIARLVLPDRLTGMLSSRRRWLDVVIFAVLGIGLLAAGLGVQAPG